MRGLEQALVRYMTEMVRWLITRERRDGDPLVAALQARGLDAVCIPAIERVPLPWPAELTPQSDDILFLTSAYAAERVREQLLLRGPSTSITSHVAALAPSTARVARAAGLVVEVEATGGAVALARALLASSLAQRIAPPRRVLYPTSDAGQAQAEQAEASSLLDGTFRVVRTTVYSTRPAPDLAARLRALPVGEARAVVFSPSAARALATAVDAARTAQLSVIAVGASTARAIQGPCTMAPPGVDIVEFLCSYDRSQPQD